MAHADLPQQYSLDEVRRHRTRHDCWLVVDGHVVDVTAYLLDHPGGDDVLLDHAGTDATDVFEKVCHSNDAYERMMAHSIGMLRPSSPARHTTRALKPPSPRCPAMASSSAPAEQSP